MIETERFADALAAKAALALSSSSTRREFFSVGDLWIELTGSAAALDRLGSAFLTRNTPAPGRMENPHRLVVWDGTSEDSLPPAPPWDASDYSPLGVVEGHGSETTRFAFDAETNAFMAFDAAREMSHIWFPDIAKLPAWATAAPFRILISWLCNLRGMQIVHGAGIAAGDQAVLLAGRGGSGKSTAALACALAGLGYLGDDYCAIQLDPCEIHLVYRTAKATRTTLEMLPALNGRICEPNAAAADKDVLVLKEQDVRLVRSAKLKAILLPRIGNESATRLHAATRADAMQAILPNTFMQLMGGTAATPRLIMQLVQSVPSFHLSLGTDLTSVTNAIAAQLAGEAR